MRKKRPQLETGKLPMAKLTSKGKHIVKVGNHLHTQKKAIQIQLKREQKGRKEKRPTKTNPKQLTKWQ